MKTKDPPHCNTGTTSNHNALAERKVHNPHATLPWVAQQRRWTTEEAATALNLQPQTIRKRHSQTGTYFSVRPIKLPNGRLSWPANMMELLINPNSQA
jgi:hypothetical protein